MEEQLIKFVRENSFIYDKTHDLYRNLVLKNKKWMEFAKYVNVPVDTLKKKWKHMRDRFLRVRKNADGSSYKYFESLKFLCDEESEKVGVNGTFLKENEDVGSIDNEELFSIDEASCSTFSMSGAVPLNPLTVPRKRKRSDSAESEMLNVFKTMKSFADQNVTPFRKFLESIALTVESANCSLMQQTRLQMKILQVVQGVIHPNFD